MDPACAGIAVIASSSPSDHPPIPRPPPAPEAPSLLRRWVAQMTEVDMVGEEQQEVVEEQQAVEEEQGAAEVEQQAPTDAAPGKAASGEPEEEPWRKRWVARHPIVQRSSAEPGRQPDPPGGTCGGAVWQALHGAVAATSVSGSGKRAVMGRCPPPLPAGFGLCACRARLRPAGSRAWSRKWSRTGPSLTSSPRPSTSRR